MAVAQERWIIMYELGGENVKDRRNSSIGKRNIGFSY